MAKTTMKAGKDLHKHVTNSIHPLRWFNKLFKITHQAQQDTVTANSANYPQMRFPALHLIYLTIPEVL